MPVWPRRWGSPGNTSCLAQNGQVIEFERKGRADRDSMPTGRVLIDGKGIGDVGRSVLKERRVLSEEGLVVVNMAFDEETGIVIYGPDIVSRGFVFELETGHLLGEAKCVILEIVEDIARKCPIGSTRSALVCRRLCDNIFTTPSGGVR